MEDWFRNAWISTGAIVGMSAVVVVAQAVNADATAVRGTTPTSPYFLAGCFVVAVFGFYLLVAALKDWPLPGRSASKARVATREQQAREQQRATLVASYSAHDDPADRHRFHRVAIHNSGPAPADRVRVQLVDVTPRPLDPTYWGHFPYPVAPRDAPDDFAGFDIPLGRECIFDAATTWIGGTDNQPIVDNIDGPIKEANRGRPVRMEFHEAWTLTFRASARNADTVQLSVVFRPNATRDQVEGQEVENEPTSAE